MQRIHGPMIAGLLCAALGARDASAQCTGCVPFMYDKECVRLDSLICVGVPGPFVIEEGAPETPQVVASCICNGCNGLGQSIECQYQHTTGLKFCFSLATGAEFGLPIGGSWSVTVTGQVCYDSTTTTVASIPVTCTSCVRRRGRVMRARVPLMVTTPIDYSERYTYTNSCQGTMGVFDVGCQTGSIISEGEYFKYDAQWDDLGCPPRAVDRCEGDVGVVPGYRERLVVHDGSGGETNVFIEEEYTSEYRCSDGGTIDACSLGQF